MYEPNEIYCLDCVEFLRGFEVGSVDAIIADPPYFLSKPSTYKKPLMFNRAHGLEDDGLFKDTHYADTEDLVAFHEMNEEWDISTSYRAMCNFNEAWLTEAYKALKPDHPILVFGTYHNIHSVGHIMRELGFSILNEIVLFKRRANPNLTQAYLQAVHEYVIWAVKRTDEKIRHFFDYKYAKTNKFEGDLFKTGGKQMKDIWCVSPALKKEKQTIIWEGRKVQHRTQKPEELIERLIRLFVRPESCVVDPFVGSGTTAVVAKRLGHDYICADKDPKYVQMAQARLSGVTTQPELW